MRCPCCNYLFECKEENRENYSCWNSHCSSREIRWIPNIQIRNNWWFAKTYTLPVKINSQWWVIEGPTVSFKTALNTVSIVKSQLVPGGLSFNYPIITCVQSIDYMALPVNENDFLREFNVLISKFDRYLNKLILF